MKLQFKTQTYQTNAVNAVVDCFAGQPLNAAARYRIDPGNKKELLPTSEGFKNAAIQISEQKVLANIKEVQKRQNLPISSCLVASGKCEYNLDVEMETGTGKTYCYIKTIFELNKCYGWSKFVIMTPSIAIREGVYKSLEMTWDHFFETYHKKARFFIYNSRRLHEIESFSSDAGINIMVVNIQAFNAQGADQRRICEELDDFQSRRPIDVIKGNRPILILDEPQKMEGKATMDALPKFGPLMILRYSATHKKNYNKVHRLDALDAYNQKLVKKIAVRGIDIRGLSGTNAYLYLESIEISKDAAPVTRVEMEVKMKSGEIRRQRRQLKLRDNLYELSGNLAAYQGFTVSQIDYNKDSVEFINGYELFAGRAVGNVEEQDLRRIQIRETIQAHLDKEKQLYGQGIKVLSLFFIDEVAKYRDYNREDEKGEYARIFEEEYERIRSEHLKELSSGDAYREFLQRDETANVHEGYFAVDKKKRLANPKIKQRGEEKGLSDDVNAYDLILKDKERLLSQTEPVRFVFSHSALREGWDNPNVFVICMLKHSDNTISRRQEVGRGLRLAVNQEGERTDDLAIVHDINILTVVAGESYKDFVLNLQREVSEALSARPRQANEAYFTGKIISTEKGKEDEITPEMATEIYHYLVENKYIDTKKHITENYHQAKETGELAPLPKNLQAYAKPIFELIDSVFSDASLPKPVDGRKPKENPLNLKNYQKKEFQELWSKINHKAIYQVEFDSDELVKKSVQALEAELRVTPLQFSVLRGVLKDKIDDEHLQKGEGFLTEQSKTEYGRNVHSAARYDLVGDVSERADLMRKTAAEILERAKPDVFNQFAQNPEHFIAQASRIITEQKATMVIEHLQYNQTDGCYDVDIFTANQSKQDLSKATRKLKKHIYQYAVTDSKKERQFLKDLDSSSEVIVYAKLPHGFLIPTPVGDYNPDWAISFNQERVQYIYFVAETKGSMSTMDLRKSEEGRIKCARKFFDKINQRIQYGRVKYEVVSDYGKLMDIVRPKTN